jgi:hypothetical protein
MSNDRKRGGLTTLLFWWLGSQLGCWGVLIGLIVLGLLTYYVIIPGIRWLIYLGVAYGALLALRDYALAVYSTLFPKKVTP